MNRSEDKLSKCVYHKDKDAFKSAMWDIRKGLSIPHKLSSRTAMVVCTCRKHPTSLLGPDVTKEDLETNDKILSKLEDNPRHRAKRGTLDFVHSVMANGTESSNKFVHFLKLASMGDFSLLEEEKRKETNLSAETRKKDTRTAASSGTKYILRKLKKCKNGVRKYNVSIPMFAGSLKKLQQEPSVGAHFRVICTKNKPCLIEVDFKTNGALMRENAQKAMLHIWCQPQKYGTITLQLTEIAERLQRAARQTYDHRKNASTMYRLINRGYDHYYDFCDPVEIKEDKWDSFSKKQHGNCRRHTQSDPIKELGLRCSKCLTERRSLKKKLSAGISTICTFHPGFLKNATWTCCGLAVQDNKSRTLPDFHETTGCTSGRHNWRYKTGKPGKVSAVNEVRFTQFNAKWVIR